MHLLVAQSGTIDDGTEPRDLGQSPGEVVVLSAADTELALLAAAHAKRQASQLCRQLRLANLLQLKHNYSVDLYIENTLAHAKVVILRLLGGESYWPYLTERLVALSQAQNLSLIVLPGDDKADLSLSRLSNVDQETCDNLWAYLVEGGIENAQGFLEAVEAYIEGAPPPLVARPLVKAGIYQHPACRSDADRLADCPTAGIIFYRALYQSGDLAGIDALINGLAKSGLRPVPIYVASLRDPVCEPVVRRILEDVQPDVILNTTAFSASKPGHDADGGVLAECDVPVLQVVLSTATAQSWAEGTNGLSARDIAMHVALPEVDGRILTRAVSFKSDATFDAGCQHYIVRAEPIPDRVDFVVRQADAWSILRHTAPSDRRVAVVLANYPNRDARIANGVGLDTPASAINVLTAMAEGGYMVADVPESGNALIAELQSGVTNAGVAARLVQHSLALSDYETMFAQLPATLRRDVVERWGAPKDDPFVTADGFAIGVRSYGNVVVGIQPARGYNIDPKATYHDPALVPPHAYFAFYFWMRKVFCAQAVVHLGKHGNLEWLPGKALALSQACYPEAALGPLPNIYPFIVNDPGEGSQAKRRTSAVIIDHLMPPLTRAETYGPLRELEVLVDEFFAADGLDEARRRFLQSEILAVSARLGLDKDFGFDIKGDPVVALTTVDNHLCELKELQIRDGLHILGEAPVRRQRRDTLIALGRVPRGDGSGSDASLLRALAEDLGLLEFDPLDTD
ncbi:MAG: cobaltochelatase subunit CobN, partial [Hyphomicrobiaceae bacterium]